LGGTVRIEVGRRAAIVIGMLAATAAGATVAGAAIPGSDGTIRGCYERQTGILRVIDAEAGRRCLPFETAVRWNQEGRQGPPGPAGPEGPRGEGVTRYRGSAEVEITPRDDSAAPSGEPIVRVPDFGWLRVYQCVSQESSDPAAGTGFAQAAFENTTAQRLTTDTWYGSIAPGETTLFGDRAEGPAGAALEPGTRFATYLLADEGLQHVAEVTVLARFNPREDVCTFDASVVTY
jgi:hypothetical protein